MYTRYHAYKSATHRFFITEACLKKGSVIHYPANMDQVEAKYPQSLATLEITRFWKGEIIATNGDCLRISIRKRRYISEIF